MFRSIRWRIAVPYVVLILLATAALALYFSGSLREEYTAELRAQLVAEARWVADAVEPLLAAGAKVETIGPAARRWGGLLASRVTVIRADGVVLGDSDQDPAAMENHLGRPEVQQALSQGVGVSTRYSQTLGYDMMYAAVPVEVDGKVAAIARAALPLTQVEAPVARLRSTLLAASLVTALLAILLAVLIAERTARPIRRLTRAAERVAEGDLNTRLFLTTHDEVGQLAVAFNHMADQLHEKVTTLAGERSRLAAVLERMADGVVITDDRGHVQLINPAATRLLGTDKANALGRSFAQVARNHRLIELWQDCREQGREQVAAVETERQGLFVQAIVTPFHEADSHDYLVILQDLTQIRRLETVRRDFISNISHELRTPLAALKALVDTLRDGALEDPPAAERFLNRMETEVDALTQMVQELLELSRIESGRAPLHLVPVPVSGVVLPPVERLRPQAERAGLTLTVTLPPGLPSVLADAERVQQVVTNLVHNAVKFTPPGGQVTVSAEGAEDEVVIKVRDAGVGIPLDALPRIFERFYKADRARSGGGTGLGLAIARHIVQAHGGRIWVESVEGHGSTFYFSLLVAGEASPQPVTYPSQ
jgi:two-component system phosphate regulon sensor histidine kinase PhoR